MIWAPPNGDVRDLEAAVPWKKLASRRDARLSP